MASRGMTAAPPDCWGTTIFCDDIRSEAGGKITLVGMYPVSLQVHSPFPVTLAKFGFWFRYFERPKGRTGNGKLLVWLPGDQNTASIEADLPLDDIRKPHDGPPPEHAVEGEFLHLWQAPMLFAPLLLLKAGRVSVRLHLADGTIVPLGTLPITGPEEANPQS